MVVAVVAMLVVQVTFHQIVHMVAVGNRLMATTRPVTMALVMPLARVAGGAGVGIGGAHLDRVLFHATLGLVVQVAVMQVVDMIAVLHRGVPAACAVLVVVVLASHDSFSLP